MRFAYLGVLVIGILSGCSMWGGSYGNVFGNNMPSTRVLLVGDRSQKDSIRTQPVLSSMRQWELVATDVGQGLCTGLNCQVVGTAKPGSEPSCKAKDKPSVQSYSYCTSARTGQASPATPECVSVAVGGDNSGRYGAFLDVLADGVVRELIRDHATVYDSNSSGPGGCDHIAVKTSVTKLTGTQRISYSAGQLSALGQGVLAIRYVVRRIEDGMTSEFAVLGIAVGETAYWVTPSYLTRHPMAEVAVTASRISSKGQYLAQFTNVYYIDARDIDEYEPARSQPAPPVQYVRSDRPLPRPYAAPAEPVSFVGATPFGAAGADNAYVVAASADGSFVVGYVRFADSRRRAHARGYRYVRGRAHVVVMTTGKSITVTDLGTMDGLEAVPTAISNDGAAIVGSVEIAPGLHAAFKWSKPATGDPRVERLGEGSGYRNANVNSVLISGDGTTVVANVKLGANGRNSFVRWATNTNGASDRLSAAIGPWQDDSDDPHPSCTAAGISDNGTTVDFVCNNCVYDWTDSRGNFEQHKCMEGGRFVAMSHDLGAAVFVDSNGCAEVEALADGHVGNTLTTCGFKPRGISPDGTVVVGRGSDGQPAFWKVRTNTVESISGTPRWKSGFAIAAFRPDDAAFLINAKSAGAGGRRASRDVAYVLAPP